MSLSEKITSDIKDAMRAKDSTKLAVLRSLKTALTNYTIEKCKTGYNYLIQIPLYHLSEEKIVELNGEIERLQKRQ